MFKPLKVIFCFSSFLFTVQHGHCQHTKSISGFIRDSISGENIIGALIHNDLDQKSTASNKYGFFSLSFRSDSTVLSVSSIGYKTKAISVEFDKDSTYIIQLVPEENQLEEVVVTGNKRKSMKDLTPGLTQFSPKEIEKVPVLFGEKDILKTIQLFPGVTSGGEGSSNFYVRGGGGDQNLILLDEAPVYNSSHLFGFFSTFNSDAIKDVNFYKGGVPAQYGGKISSVMEITTLDGNNQHFNVEGGLGLIASRLKLEGPIQKGKSSFMISGRRTYADLFLKLSNDENVKKSALFFYDLNAKVNYRINDKNTIYLSGYFGKDAMAYHDLFDFNWGNATGTIRWNHVWGNRLFSNTTFIFSKFNYQVSIEDDNNFKIRSDIYNYNFKQDFQYSLSDRHNLKFGLQTALQEIRPASIEAGEDSRVNSLRIQHRKGIDIAAYLADDWSITDKVKLNYGIRATGYATLGPGMFYTFDKDGEPIDSTYVRDGKLGRKYLYLEPRVSLNYAINESTTLKASYNTNVQYLHQLSNTTSSLPTDQYVLSNNTIKPQISKQYSLGYFKNFAANRYEFSVEGYYRNLQNQIDYRNGADLQANEFLDGQLLFGKGRAFGIEWFLKKRLGQFSGWLSYTLSKSERKFAQINEGEWFNARQDKTHNIAVVAQYQVNPKWNLSANFVYYTGDAVTMPAGKYFVDDRTIFYYDRRNGQRMPAYHRLDLAATYDIKRSKNNYSSISFGIYNAYNRKNAYLIDFREKEGQSNVTEIYRIALFGIIPSITWNFKF
ncbi:TonB-dependent receptor [Sphingobacterium sp. N143]|uniref:TonB-dependent receptor n=1 Tax=Sphingobacterium sp. N143 TaxID=2746727 RepID=UPI0025764414|nr:TonB-dependent receptor [Sphingobacterium sp. N143]MDM1296388.1 TonB-dependent receptor [Sphingobacterium sp. N143]